MAQKTIALQLRTLAADPDSQSLLLKEASCLTGLVALLNADNDEEVLILSLQALQFLARPSSHQAVLVNQQGLVLALTLLTDKPSIAIKTLAQDVLSCLEAYINGASASGSNSTTSSASHSRRTSSHHARTGSRSNTRPTTPSASRDLTSGAVAPRYLSNVLFHVTVGPSGAAPDKLQQSEVEKVLVGIKGVISVTHAASASGTGKPCFTLYTSLRPAALVPLVTKVVGDLRAGYHAVMLTKDGKEVASVADKENQDNGQDVGAAKPSYLKPAGGAAGAAGSSAGGPSYLKPKTTGASSSGGPAYLSSSSGSTASTGGSRALTTHATVTSASDSAQGLAARYQAAAAKKKIPVAAAAAPEAQKKGGLLSSVTSFFW